MALVRTEKASGRIRNRPLKDHAGLKMGRLEVLSLSARDPAWGNHLWDCRCECGKVKAIGIKSILSGKTRSCGCIFAERFVDPGSEPHGKSKTQVYRTWIDMRKRCNNPKDPNYKHYGGRGISVCERWGNLSSFIEDMGEPEKGFTLDRIDVNGGYEPSNCRWATMKEQANNKRSTKMIEWSGKSQSITQWCEELGVKPSQVRYRLKRCMPLEQVFANQGTKA